MVVYLQTTSAAVLTNLAAATALGILDEAE
jgi:hypothetical protein